MKTKLIVDIFAGGGGVSTGIYMATGRHPDIAINHSDDALSMHRVNHPKARHFIADVYEVCPLGATQGKPVGWLHMSPDCRHHSQAAGGQPRSNKIRGLAWVGYRWAGQVKPDVISLENVTQILKWGPLIAKRCKSTGRVIKLDGTVALPGERVPVQEQYLIPNPKRAGQTWRRFTAAIQSLGYSLESKTLCAADFGAPTTRERLFMIARRDGNQIAWPEPSHFKKPTKEQTKWRAAAECIDFNIPCQSIFDRKKPLADATMRRIAKGLKRYVLESADPYIVQIAHYDGQNRTHSIHNPLKTITAATKGGEFAMGVPVIVPATHQGADRVNDIQEPLKTVTAAHRGEMMLSTPILVKFRAESSGSSIEDPTATITTENRLCTLSPEHEEKAQRVAAFLMHYYTEGGSQHGSLKNPMATITTKDRLALVTVTVNGTPHVIIDIGLRMLQPAELFRAQEFPDTYGIEQGHDGRKFSKTIQVRLCGNSVPPPLMEAIVRANIDQAGYLK